MSANPNPDVQMDPPANPEASSSRIKRKRSLGSSNPSSSQTKKARKVFAMRPRKPKRPSDWHLRKGEVPKEAEKTKVHTPYLQSLHSLTLFQAALELHL